MERKERGGTPRNFLMLQGIEYQLNIGTSFSTWNTEVSHGYGNAYVRNAKYGQLRGEGFITDAEGQVTHFRVKNYEREVGKLYSDRRDLHDYFRFYPVDREAYTDFIAARILSVFEDAGDNQYAYQQPGSMLAFGRLDTIQLEKFAKGLEEELVEAGLIPETHGQIRIPVDIIT